eukprot:CAMPEP_0170979100 /NCGR_PEP_ID=MMETSP0736-20130129/1595_1 /TAXON_ID=186038 /ORGANISM="Fragilariopsis kerguelensis, Strain L26-C5" /LENGTH=505 /DNA_ID=CAMNT_0011401599 /DNA_START=219 /DNA_END=1736 /DNA_ORIENTATION=-
MGRYRIGQQLIVLQEAEKEESEKERRKMTTATTDMNTHIDSISSSSTQHDDGIPGTGTRHLSHQKRTSIQLNKFGPEVKYKKAPQAPRRFKSPYIFYSTTKHKEIRAELMMHMEEGGPKLNTPEVAKLVSKAWKALSKEERQKWDDLATQDRERYEKEKLAYTGPWKVPVQVTNANMRRGRYGKRPNNYSLTSTMKQQQQRKGSMDNTNGRHQGNVHAHEHQHDQHHDELLKRTNAVDDLLLWSRRIDSTGPIAATYQELMMSTSPITTTGSNNNMPASIFAPTALPPTPHHPLDHPASQLNSCASEGAGLVGAAADHTTRGGQQQPPPPPHPVYSGHPQQHPYPPQYHHSPHHPPYYNTHHGFSYNDDTMAFYTNTNNTGDTTTLSHKSSYDKQYHHYDQPTDGHNGGDGGGGPQHHPPYPYGYNVPPLPPPSAAGAYYHPPPQGYSSATGEQYHPPQQHPQPPAPLSALPPPSSKQNDTATATTSSGRNEMYNYQLPSSLYPN